MPCPVCNQSAIIEIDSMVFYACGYYRCPSVRIGEVFYAVNGSIITVKHVHPLTGFFLARSVNSLGQVQTLWYDRDGLCMSPTGKTRWEGDDIRGNLASHINKALDNECNTRVSESIVSRWDLV